MKSLFYKIIYSISMTIIGVFSMKMVSGSDIDSLKNLLSEQSDLKDKYEVYHQLVEAYIYSDLTLSKAYADSMLMIGDELNNEELIMRSAYDFAVVYRMQGQYDKSLEEQKKYLQYALTQSDRKAIAKSYYQIGACYMRLGKNDKSMENFMKALTEAENLGEKTLSAQVMNAIASLHKAYGDFDKALEYFQRSKEIAEENGSSNDLAIIYNGIGLCYRELKKPQESFEYFKKSLSLAQEVNNVAVVGYQYRNIGVLLMNEGRYEESEEYLKKALKFREDYQDTLALGGSHHDLGNLYLSMGKLDKSEYHLIKSLDLLKTIEADYSSNIIYDKLIALFKEKENYERALYYTEIYAVSIDSMRGIEMHGKVMELEEKYQSEKKEKELVQSEFARKKEEEKNKLYTVIGFGLVLIILALIYSIMQRQKRKNEEILTLKKETQIKSLESLIEGEEKERTRLARELHDGINGDLSALKFKLSTLQKTNNQVISEAVAMIDKSCEQVRAISHNLMPPSLENFDMGQTIEAFCNKMDAIYNVQISFQKIGESFELSQDQEVNMFRIVQELIGNSIKHSEATEIMVQLSSHANRLQLTVEDNGKGFDPEKTIKKGIGLQNIKSRVDYLGAEMDFHSDDSATSYTIELNLK